MTFRNPSGRTSSYQRRQENLESNASRLFVPSGGELELIDISPGGPHESRVVRKVSDSSHLEPAADASLRAQASRFHQRIYVIRQEFTWGRFCVTLAVFTKLVKIEEISSPFLDWTQAFGRKIKENHSKYRGFWGCGSAGYKPHSEVCYNLHHVERNARDNGDPWSVRQTGVYHKFRSPGTRSCWILLQPTRYACSRLEQILHKYNAGNSDWLDGCARAHSVILTSMMDNWPEYISYLGSELDELDEKAAFSRVGRKHRYDYTLTFVDRRKVHRLQEKLRQCRFVLRSCIEVAKRCGAHFDHLTVSEIHGCVPKSYLFEMYIVSMERQCRLVIDLIDRAAGTADLLSRIIDFRNDESIRETHSAIQASLGTLQNIAAQSLQKNEILSRVAQQGRYDSKILKVLTVIATIYLPATLTATIFSSDLISAKALSDPREATHFVLASQFWIYATITIPLMILTGVLAVFLEQRWKGP